MAKTKQKKIIPSKYTWEQLEEALFNVYDLMQDAQLDFFPMNKTAIQMHDNAYLEGDKLVFGVRKQDLAESTIEMLKISNPSIDLQPKKIILKHNGIPIEIRIITKHYRVLDNLDTIDYAYETFLMPNPFEAFKRMMWFMY
jgi:hypothetical protein